MAKEKLNFIITKYKNQKAEVHFYTRKGERVSCDSVKRAPTQEKVEFYIETERNKSDSKENKRK